MNISIKFFKKNQGNQPNNLTNFEIKFIRQIFLYLIIGSISFLSSCKTKKVVIDNFSFNYNHSLFKLNPQLKLFKKNYSDYTLYCKINIKDLHFSSDPDSLSGNYNLFFTIYPVNKNGIPLSTDTLSDYFSINPLLNSQTFTEKFNIPNINPDFIGFIFHLKNLNTKQTLNKSFLRFDNKGEINYLIYKTDDSTICHDNFLVENTTYNLLNYKSNNTYLYYSDVSFPSAKAPYLDDTLNKRLNLEYFTLCRENNFEKSGLYFFKPDTIGVDTNYCFSKMCFDEDFIEQKTALSLLEPLIYLKSEISLNNNNLDSKKTKNEVDRFWLNITKNDKDKSREMIRVFYNRVILSNKLFTSYKEGWKTDRGMLLIILGLPENIKIGSNKEIWTYKSKEKGDVCSFTFYKTNNFFNNNDFNLERNPSYKRIWDEAINTWLKGDIYIY